MAEMKTYQLIGYDVETGKEVLNWGNCADISRPVAGLTPSVIEHGGHKWQVIGVRTTSTREVHRIDVRKLE